MRALDQGERTYIAMCCGGYSAASSVFYSAKPFVAAEWVFLIFSIGYLVAFPILIYAMI